MKYVIRAVGRNLWAVSFFAEQLMILSVSFSSLREMFLDDGTLLKRLLLLLAELSVLWLELFLLVEELSPTLSVLLSILEAMPDAILELLLL